VPCFRQARFLSRALDSVLQQSVPAEVVVIDDGSPDNVGDACAPYPAVKYVRQEHRGLSAARNRGIAETHGELLHFLDADDAAGPDMYALLAGALAENPSWAAAVSGTQVMHEDGRLSPLRIDPPPTSNLFEALGRHNLFPPGAVLLRRAILDQTGPFDEMLDATADWDLWLRVARTGVVFGSVGHHLFEYRTYPTSMSRADPIAMFEAQREILWRARRPDPRVRGAATRYSQGANGDDLDTALASCAASSLGLAIGHCRSEDMLVLLHTFASHLGEDLLTTHHLQSILAEASITLGFLPPDRNRTWHACAASLANLRSDARGPRLREIVVQIIDFLERGIFADNEGESIVPVPIFGSMSSSVTVSAPATSRMAVVMAPWRETVDGTVRLRIFNPDKSEVLREASEAIDRLSAPRTVWFKFAPLKGFAGQTLTIDLTTDTNQLIAIYEPAASAKSLGRRVLRKLSLDRRAKRLYSRAV